MFINGPRPQRKHCQQPRRANRKSAHVWPAQRPGISQNSDPLSLLVSLENFKDLHFHAVLVMGAYLSKNDQLLPQSNFRKRSTPRATAPDGQAGKAESHQQDHDGDCPHESRIASSSLASARAFPDGTVGVSVARRGFDDADADRFPRPVSGAMIVELPLDPDAIAGLIGRRHRAAGCTLPEKEEPGHRQGREDEERVPEHPGSQVSPHHPIVRMPSRISDVRPPARE